MRQRFGHILYTGGARVGRIVMAAAARHLTPVTLELGGKCPVYVHGDANLALAARRIAWGKFYNAGQSCIAPDYILAHEAIEAELVEQLCAVIRRFYGDDPRSSADYGRIVNAQHLARIARLLDGPANVAMGGQIDPGNLYMAPTVLRDVSADDPVMQEEIFGPILPVLRIRGREEASTFINQRPTPLAVYVFSRARNVCAAFARSTPAGGVCANHVLVHALNQALPFGGLGESGLGAYTGRHSFDTFTHWKPVMEAGTWPDVRSCIRPTPTGSAPGCAASSARRSSEGNTLATTRGRRGPPFGARGRGGYPPRIGHSSRTTSRATRANWSTRLSAAARSLRVTSSGSTTSPATGSRAAGVATAFRPRLSGTMCDSSLNTQTGESCEISPASDLDAWAEIRNPLHDVPPHVTAQSAVTPPAASTRTPHTHARPGAEPFAHSPTFEAFAPTAPARAARSCPPRSGRT